MVSKIIILPDPRLLDLGTVKHLLSNARSWLTTVERSAQIVRVAFHVHLFLVWQRGGRYFREFRFTLPVKYGTDMHEHLKS